MPIVTLLTDFGLADTYVGQVKGAILGICPQAQIVDLTHDVPAQDVFGGAFLLWTAVDVFPPGTVHLGVVDPGVGTTRKALAVRSRRGDVFVGPDNGLLVPAIDRLGGAAIAVELTRRDLWRTDVSSTFHGRDVFAPVAAHLANGLRVEEAGTPVAELERPFRLGPPTKDDRGLVGSILHVDGYGNLVTNLPGSILPPRFAVTIHDHTIREAPHASYQAVATGTLLALVGSSGLLEIAARDASAAQIVGGRRGDVVRVVLA